MQQAKSLKTSFALSKLPKSRILSPSLSTRAIYTSSRPHHQNEATAILSSHARPLPRTTPNICIRSHVSRCYSSANDTASHDPPAQTTSDPTRPDIFYHLVSLPASSSSSSPPSSIPAYAISFLPTPPPSPHSSTVLGWLPAVADGGDQDAGLNDFQENPNFRTILHRAIQTGLREGADDIQTNGALQLQNGWMHIHDERNIPALGRVGDPDDILASVLVQDSNIQPETYQAMPSYRLCTVDGPTQLTEGLALKLRLLLEETAAVEQRS